MWSVGPELITHGSGSLLQLLRAVKKLPLCASNDLLMSCDCLSSLYSCSICSLVSKNCVPSPETFYFELGPNWLEISVEIWKPEGSWFRTLLSFQFGGLPCNFQQRSLVWFVFLQKSRRRLFLLEFLGDSWPRTARVQTLSNNGFDPPIITCFWLASLRTSANISAIIGRGLIPRSWPLTSSRSGFNSAKKS